jgi:hypothetical protein
LILFASVDKDIYKGLKMSGLQYWLFSSVACIILKGKLTTGSADPLQEHVRRAQIFNLDQQLPCVSVTCLEIWPLWTQNFNYKLHLASICDCKLCTYKAVLDRAHELPIFLGKDFWTTIFSLLVGQDKSLNWLARYPKPKNGGHKVNAISSWALRISTNFELKSTQKALRDGSITRLWIFQNQQHNSNQSAPIHKHEKEETQP